MKKLAGLIILIIELTVCKAQPDRFFTPYHGLSNTSFNCITQDSDGFIWIATNSGLNKFDGYNFTVYKHNSGDTNSLDIDLIFSAFADSKGKLWVGTSQGLYTYNKKLDNFSRYPIKLKNRDYSLIITAILEDKQHNLWLTTSMGLVRINLRTNEQYFFNHQYTDSINLVRDMINTGLIDDDGKIWLASDKNGLFVYDPVKNEFTNYRHDQGINSICDNSITSLAKDPKGNIIIGPVKGGISIFNRTTKKFRTIGYNHSKDNEFNGGVYSIVTSKDGTIWVGTERNGLKTLDLNTYTLKDANNSIDVDNVNDSKVHCFNDHQGNLWLGIDYTGFYLKKEKAKPFTCYRKKSNSPSNLSNNIIKAILLDENDDLWLGTDGGGLNLIKNKTSKVKVFMRNPDNPASLPDNAVISLFEDKKQNLWVGTYLGGLSLFDRKREKFKTFLIDPLRKGRDYNYVTSITPDKYDNLWVTTNGGGLQYFNTRSQTFTSYSTIIIDKKSINLPLFLTTALIDKDNTLWVGSYFGLFNWNKEKGTYNSYTSDNGKLESDAIYSLFEDQKSNIWFGTSNGLYEVEKQTGSFRRYTIADGLPNNSVFGILQDRKGKLWLSTLNGISKFDPELKTFRNYYTYDGLPGNEFRPASCFKAQNGKLYFGSTSGAVCFDPDSIGESSDFPNLVFTKLKIFNSPIPMGKLPDGRVILDKSVNETGKITLNHSDNSFTIEFAAIDYFAPEKIKYSYMMEGFDQKWITKDFGQRYANYTNLYPGTYNFKLKSTNNDGVWNEKFKTITFVINPPFWKTWWAYIVYTSLLVLAYFITRKQMLFRISMKNKLEMEHLERERLEEFNQSKMQFFSNVSHEFRTPLTLILGPVERLMLSNIENPLKKQVEFIHRNAKRLLRLVNLLLDLQKVEKNEMHLKVRYGDIVAFTKEITYSFEELTRSKKINLSFKSDFEKLDMWFDPDKLDKVFFNLLSNALKFTLKGGTISVDLSIGKNETFPAPLDEYVNISVTDTGKGMKEEYLHKIFERFYQIDDNDSQLQLGTGIGLHLSKYLVELHKGIISVASKEDEGTRFDVFIPRGSDHLNPDQIVVEHLSHTIIDGEVEDFFPIEDSTNGETDKFDAGSKSEKPYKILIVEDDYEIRTYIKSELSDRYEIIEAIDGIDGYSVVQKQMPDLIISDVMMPGMDGFEFCKKIKTDINTSHIPVILLTARTSMENRIEGLENGADSYIPKPFHPQHLKVRVEKLIELRRNMMNKFSKTVSFEAKEMTLTSADERFLQKAIALVKDNISNSELNIEEMGSELGMSRVHLYRKLKALTDQTPSEFVRTIRLKQAAYLLAQNKINISEVAYAVGFGSHQYFSNCFQNYFSMSPTEYCKKAKEENITNPETTGLNVN